MNTQEFVRPASGLVRPPGGDQAQPACFGIGQLRIPERPESGRLCSACMSFGRLNNTHWGSINNFRAVFINHHHSFDALLTSAREGCHLCGLLLIAWEEKCRFDQEPGGGWVANGWLYSASLNAGIRLEFQRVRKTIPWTSVDVDEVEITIRCGNLPSSMRGRLICRGMHSERSSPLKRPQSFTIN